MNSKFCKANISVQQHFNFRYLRDIVSLTNKTYGLGYKECWAPLIYLPPPQYVYMCLSTVGNMLFKS